MKKEPGSLNSIKQSAPSTVMMNVERMLLAMNSEHQILKHVKSLINKRSAGKKYLKKKKNTSVEPQFH